MDVDRNGWVTSRINALPLSGAYTLLAPDPSSRIDIAVWAHKARSFFSAAVELCQPKAYPNGAWPEADAVEVEIDRGKRGSRTRLLVVTLPVSDVPEARAAGEAGARAIGGAGMDLLVDRTKRVWQIGSEVTSGTDTSAPLALAAIIASVLLSPIVPPEGGTIFGVKGARERLKLS